MWLNIEDDEFEKIVASLKQHAPELAEKMLHQAASWQPEEKWQNQHAAVKWARSRWQHEEEIGIDDDAAVDVHLEKNARGVYIQAWLWVPRKEIEDIIVEEVHEL